MKVNSRHYEKQQISMCYSILTLQWRPNKRDGVWNHGCLDCLLNRLFRRGSKKSSKLRVIGLCEGNPPVAGGFPSQRPVTGKLFLFDDVIMEAVARISMTDLWFVVVTQVNGILCFQTQWFIAILHTMMTSSNGNISRVIGHLCGEFISPGEFPPQRPVTRSFDVFFDLRLNKRLSKQSWGWWFETQSRPLWRRRNAVQQCQI